MPERATFDVKTHWEGMAVPRMISLRELRGCYFALGRFRKAQLFVAGYEDGRREVVYPIHTPGGSVIYATVGEINA